MEKHRHQAQIAVLRYLRVVRVIALRKILPQLKKMNKMLLSSIFILEIIRETA